jgi:hypothetical protein
VTGIKKPVEINGFSVSGGEGGFEHPQPRVNTSIPTKTGKRLAFYRSPTRDYQELKQEFGLAHYEGRG